MELGLIFPVNECDHEAQETIDQYIIPKLLTVLNIEEFVPFELQIDRPHIITNVTFAQ